MKTENILAVAAGFLIGYSIFKPKSAAVGASNFYRSFSVNKPIVSVAMAKDFFRWLLYEQAVNFHPDDSFENYVDENNQPTFTKATAKKLNERMNEVFELMGEKIYDLGIAEMELYEKRLGTIPHDVAAGWKRLNGNEWRKVKPGTKRHAKILMLPDGVFYEAHSGLNLKFDSVSDAMTKAKLTDLLDNA